MPQPRNLRIEPQPRRALVLINPPRPLLVLPYILHPHPRTKVAEYAVLGFVNDGCEGVVRGLGCVELFLGLGL